ncbi:hypothetical protein I7I51_08057 [Histoplasma capsulatum]|uniref:Aminoglycoside phosphotransferase domain-containing protein n=1 Tax=Ajellomyces capsulatus TaxID=5037 RepID=A0A8A1LXK4_AJECA|nr:hypothetical protein I7I51_08057 [Histoplasma capsulatum]
MCEPPEKSCAACGWTRIYTGDPYRHSHPEGRDGRYFVLNERVGGQTLEEAWTSLSEPQKLDVADQVVKVRKKLRSVTSTSIQCVDQSSSYPGLLFFDLEPRGPFHSDQKLWDALALSLRHLPQQVLENLRKSLPMCEPYVLTHCDLNLGNIMVQDGKVVGILDWEYAAFFLFEIELAYQAGWKLSWASLKRYTSFEAARHEGHLRETSVWSCWDAGDDFRCLDLLTIWKA